MGRSHGPLGVLLACFALIALLLRRRRPRSSRRLLAGVLLVLCLAGYGPAISRAQELQELSAGQRTLARQLFQQGVEQAQAGHWEQARQSFQQAYDLVQNPAILLNLAGSQVQSGHLVEGAETYRTFLRVVTEGRLVSQRPAAQQALAEVDDRIPRLRLVIPGLLSSDVVRLDGAELPRAVIDHELPVGPGAHQVSVMRRGDVLAEDSVTLAEHERRDFRLTLPTPEPIETSPQGPTQASGDEPGVSGEDASVDLDVQQRAAHATHGQRATGGVRRSLGWVGVGLGVAGLAVAGVSAGLGLSERNSVYATCSAGASMRECPAGADVSDGTSRFKRDRGLMWGASIAAGVLLTAGVALLLTGRSSSESRVSAGAACAASGCAAGVTGSF